MPSTRLRSIAFLFFVALIVFARPSGATPYVLVHLGPPGTASAAFAASDGAQGGYIMYQDAGGYLRRHAVVWYGTPESVVELHPAGWCETHVDGISGGRFVGSGVQTSTSGAPWHALAWSGTPAVMTDLHPATAFGSTAKAAAGSQVVGYTSEDGPAQHPRAQLWVGAAAPIDLTPVGAAESVGYGTSGTDQVGHIAINAEQHAVRWFGTPGSYVDLHPVGLVASSAYATDGTYQVGYIGTMSANHACLWQGTASSVVDLHPSSDFTFSYGMDVCGGVQVGNALDAAFKWYAFAWTGSAASAVPLYNQLPVGWRNSWAEAVDAYGNIAGYYEDPTWGRAVVWAPQRPSSTVSALAVSGGAGQAVTLTASLAATTGGIALTGRTVHFILDRQEVGTAVTDGSGVAMLACTLPSGVGAHNLACAFAGDGGYAPSCGVTTATVKSATRVWVVPTTGRVGATVRLQGVLIGSNGIRPSGRTLHFSVNGSEIGTGTTQGDGYAACSYTIPAGSPASVPVTVAFTDTSDPTYLTSSNVGTLSVDSRPLTRIWCPAVSGTAGSTVRLQGVLMTSVGGTRLVGETLTFWVGGVQVGSGTTQADGYAACSYTIPAGSPSSVAFTVQYAGTTGYAPSSGSGSISVSGLPATALWLPAVLGSPGQSVYLQAVLRVPSTGERLVGKTVHFSLGGVPVGDGVTAAYGYASVPFTVPAGGGSLPIVVTFDGDASYQPCTGTGTLTRP